METIRNLFWEVAARLGFWIPCDKHMPNKKYWDWVMISYHENCLNYRHIPKIAEYSFTKKEWHDDSEGRDDEYLNKMCNVTHWRKIPNDRNIPIKK